MKKLLCILLTLALLAGCAAPAVPTTEPRTGEVLIRLSDEDIEFPADSGVSISEEAAYTRVRITEETGPVPITPDLQCVYHLEAGLSVLDFEIVE